MSNERGSEHLTDEERARLRSTVNVDALERVLSAAPRDSHQLLFLACTWYVTDDQLVALGLEVPPRSKELPIPVTLADGREAQGLQFLPTQNTHLVLHHLPEPELDRLWQDVEPSVHRGA